MGIIRGFLPWIAYGIIANYGWKEGALAALVISVVLLVADRIAGVRADAQVLEIGGAIFFAVMTGIAFLAPHSGVDNYDSSLAFGWLAITAWVSLAIKRPFTLGIAKREVPEEFWGTARFRRANVVITTAWALAFTLTCAAVTYIYLKDLGDTPDLIAQIVGFVVPISFTNWYKERGAAAADAVQPA